MRYLRKKITKSQEIYDKELNIILSDDEKPIWQAIILRYNHSLGGTKAFDKLVKHVEENKNNPEVIWQLAMRYKDMREYEIAKDKFLLIKNLYDINKEQASLCLALMANIMRQLIYSLNFYITMILRNTKQKF